MHILDMLPVRSNEEKERLLSGTRLQRRQSMEYMYKQLQYSLLYPVTDLEAMVVAWDTIPIAHSDCYIHGQYMRYQSSLRA
ncbi:hypothetical protein IWQ61_006460 [Dispira simplex]|nr:hypothetical protein IWQ61_006460 [Dispira simplex]